MTRCIRLCRSYVDDRRRTVSPGLYACLEVLTDTYARRLPPPAAIPEPRTSLDEGAHAEPGR